MSSSPFRVEAELVGGHLVVIELEILEDLVTAHFFQRNSWNLLGSTRIHVKGGSSSYSFLVRLLLG